VKIFLYILIIKHYFNAIAPFRHEMILRASLKKVTIIPEVSMSNTTRNVLIACGVLLIVVCACISFVLLGGLSIWMTDREIVTDDIAPIVSTVIAEITPEETLVTGEIATPTLPQAGGEEPGDTQDAISDEVKREMDQIQQQVTELRELQPAREVKLTLLTPDELREKVISDFFEDYSEEEAIDDTIVMAVFDLLDVDFNLIDFYIDLFSEQIAGFYDDESEEMYVVRGSGFGGPERLTFAHEYVHVLQDQNYDIEHGLNYTDELCEADSEHCAAIQALLEGDASLLELMWFSIHASEVDRREIIDFYGQFMSPVYDSAPDFMKQDFLFPYQAGQEFVEYLYDSGGWEAVNDAYEDLPLSTEQILHPDRYPDDKPVPVNLPDFSERLGSDWRELDRGVMGEWSTYLILGYGMNERARLSDNDAKSAADGWGGDAYVVYSNEAGSTAMVLRTIWDTLQEANEFGSHFEVYAENRFGNPIISQSDLSTWEEQRFYTEFHREGVVTTWISAPDSETAAAIWEMISQSP
jgi:hypothetical protein